MATFEEWVQVYLAAISNATEAEVVSFLTGLTEEELNELGGFEE